MRSSRAPVIWLSLGFVVCAISIATSRVHSLDSCKPAAESAARPFVLIDHNGEQVSDTDFRGKWLLVYFGFTDCPDACPLSMSNLAAAVRLLGSDANRLRVAFISIDPEHDTPVVLSRYLANFSKSFTGLTGSKAAIAQVLATFDAYAVPRSDRDIGTSTIEHSSSFYLLDPSGRFQRRLSPELDGRELASTLRKIVTTAPSGRGCSTERIS